MSEQERLKLNPDTFEAFIGSIPNPRVTNIERLDEERNMKGFTFEVETGHPIAVVYFPEENLFAVYERILPKAFSYFPNEEEQIENLNSWLVGQFPETKFVFARDTDKYLILLSHNEGEGITIDEVEDRISEAIKISDGLLDRLLDYLKPQ